jgi:hypothetical protein
VWAMAGAVKTWTMWAGLLAASAVVLATAAPAQAVRVTSFDDTGYNGRQIPTVGIYAVPGEVNTLTLTGLPPDPDVVVHLDPTRAGSVLIRDTSATITTDSDDCLVIDAHTARCTGPGGSGVDTIAMQLEDRSDTLRIPTHSAPLYLEGNSGSGNDRIENSSSWLGIFGAGSGNDHIVVRGGGGGGGPIGPSVSGDAGDDLIDARNANIEDILCGDGHDRVLGDNWDEPYLVACEEFEAAPIGVIPLI